jgi:hypothetical protein
MSVRELPEEKNQIGGSIPPLAMFAELAETKSCARAFPQALRIFSHHLNA